MSKMNPQIRTIEVGRKSLREVTIYPLSLTDQFRTTDLITELVSQTLNFLEKRKEFETEEEVLQGMDLRDVDVIKVLVLSIEKNLVKILEFVVDPGEKIELDDLTNLQFSELADLIFDVNYSGAMGNFQGLINKIKKLLPSMRPSQQSSPEPATDLNTSSLSALGTEE